MNTLNVKKWLLETGTKQIFIARKAEVSPTLVSLVIKGDRKNQKVKNTLLILGCPRRFLEGYEGNSEI